MASDTRIASRYAKSLLSLGVEQNNLDTIYKDMLVMQETLRNREFKMFVKSPIIHADKKQSVFAQIFGDSVSKVTTTFFNILSRKGREVYLPEMVDSFIHQYKKYNKVTEVKLTTATPIGENMLNDIKKSLEKSEATEQTVEIETHVNPDLIGGFVIEMDDKLYDASVAHKLDQIKKNFLSN